MLLMVLSGAFHIFKQNEVIDELDLSSVKIDHNEFNGCANQGVVRLHGHPNRQKAVQEKSERYSIKKNKKKTEEREKHRTLTEETQNTK